jgi:hypothetical protein
MKKYILTLTIAIALATTALAANAANYNLVNEKYTLDTLLSPIGTHVNVNSPLQFNVVDANKTNLGSGEYTNKLSLETPMDFDVPMPYVLNQSYNFIMTTTTPTDQLFGTFTVTRILTDAQTTYVSRIFEASSQYTSGNGLFSGATGTGSFEITYNTSTKIMAADRLYATFSTPTAPIPEADTSTMLLMGAGIMGFIARRRKNTNA